MHSKAFVGSCLLLGTVGGFVGWASTSDRQTGPHLYVHSVIEMATLDYDEYRDVSFKLRNDGTAILELKPPITGCACTTGTLSKSSLQPGETTEVAIRYHAAQYPGTKINQAVILPSNCREAPNRQVMLHGKMRGALLAAPAAVAVGGMHPGEAWERSVRVRHSDADVRYQLICATTGVDGWSVSVEQVKPDECVLRISSSGNAVIGTQRGLVFVETDLASKPLEILVTVDVRSELRAVPSPLVFRRQSSNDPFEEDVLSIRGPNGMRLTPIVEDSAIECLLLYDEDSDNTVVKYRTRVSRVPTENERGAIEFRVEGVSHESTFSVPYLVVP